MGCHMFIYTFENASFVNELSCVGAGDNTTLNENICICSYTYIIYVVEKI